MIQCYSVIIFYHLTGDEKVAVFTVLNLRIKYTAVIKHNKTICCPAFYRSILVQ